MTTVKIVFHEKLNAIRCVCGYIGTFHECKEKIQGKIIFVRCSEKNCSACQENIERDEYNMLRWGTDRDGYLVCGTCYDKLGTNEICENCFCRICYVSVDKYCTCPVRD